ncbi:MAG: hypothetical protein H6732_00135 [Alphaproteobacteria bacterium]|nr:hypothetical protein [Alphaproteobacteria bacterium]
MIRSTLRLAALGLVACGSPSTDTTDTDTDAVDTDVVDTGTDQPADLNKGPIAVAGDWAASFMGTAVIDDVSWDLGYALANLTKFSNGERWAVGSNGDGTWSRFDWAADGPDGWWYCQQAYDAATESTALTTPPADATDPETTGCGAGDTVFGWTRLFATHGRNGQYTDDGGATHTVTTWTWQTTNGTDTAAFALGSWDVGAGWITAKDDESGTWSRLTLLDVGDDLWMCAGAVDLVDEAAAIAAPAPATDAPETGGCQGEAWTKLTAQ